MKKESLSIAAILTIAVGVGSANIVALDDVAIGVGIGVAIFTILLSGRQWRNKNLQ